MTAGPTRLAARLPAERPGRPASADLVARRLTVEAAAPTGVVGHRRAGDPWLRIGDGDDGDEPGGGPILVYLHGGGYRMGSAASSAGFATRLHAATGAEVLVVDYRLAPEHPFPAALRDAVVAFDAVTAEAPGAPVVLVGDSAGGGLALAVSSWVVGGGGPAPAGIVLLSPWVDLTITAGSYDTCRERDELFSRGSAAAAAAGYLAGHPADDPLVSPLFGDLAGLPPVHVQCSAHEVLRDDTVALVAALAAAGVDVECRVVPGVPHVFPIVQPDAPASAVALEAVARFVGRVAVTETV